MVSLLEGKSSSFPTPDLLFAHGDGRRTVTTPTMGIFQIMVLRVVALDSEPSVSAEELYNLTFVDEVSLKHQLFRCSFGKLDVQSKYGVLNVPIRIKAQGVDRKDVIREAYNVAPSLVRELVQDVRTLVDAVMVVLPPGTAGPWAAYGTVRGKQSVYNDKWVSFVGAAIHEVSHNLGLYHANENGVEYADETGYMGAAEMEMHSPQKCFNGQNHYHLGWFSDRATDLRVPSLLVSPEIVKIAAFVDYGKLYYDDQVVLVRVEDIYLQFNRAKGMNKDTAEMRDQLTIVQEIFKGTELLAGLDSTNPIFSLMLNTYYDRLLTIQVCGMSIQENEEAIDEMVVGIGFENSPCDAMPISPSEPPTKEPHTNIWNAMPTTMYNPQPSASPSTSQPVPMPVSKPPTSLPTSFYSPPPSVVPWTFAPNRTPVETPMSVPTILAHIPTSAPMLNPFRPSSAPTFIAIEDDKSFGAGSAVGDGSKKFSDREETSFTFELIISLLVLMVVLITFTVAVICYKSDKKRNVKNVRLECPVPVAAKEMFETTLELDDESESSSSSNQVEIAI